MSGAVTILRVALIGYFATVISGQEVNFYDDDGNVFTLTITGGCYNFKPKWDKRATAIEVDSRCYNIWDRHDCKGAQLQVQGGPRGIKKLADVNFDKSISSINLCSPEDTEQATYDGRGDFTMTEIRNNSPKSTTVPRSTLQEVREVAVEEHNKYRRKHGVPSLQGDPQLHESAQRWAEHLAAQHRFEPSQTFRYGENLAASFRRNKVDAVRDAIKRWYDKIQNYDFERPGYNVDGLPSGSFSAIVWKTTTKMGIGIAWDEQEEAYVVVAFYDPQGSNYSTKRIIQQAFELEEASSGKTCHLHWSEHLRRVVAAFVLLGMLNGLVWNGCFQAR